MSDTTLDLNPVELATELTIAWLATPTRVPMLTTFQPS